MIVGIGVDVVYVHRLKRWQEIPGLLQRYFHEDELAASLERGDAAYLSLAVRFAAKEAFGKALGTGLEGIMLKDVMVKSHRNGRPEMFVKGTALAALEKSGAVTIHLSLTHEKDNAIAMVVLEK